MGIDLPPRPIIIDGTENRRAERQIHSDGALDNGAVRQGKDTAFLI